MASPPWRMGPADLLPSAAFNAPHATPPGSASATHWPEPPRCSRPCHPFVPEKIVFLEVDSTSFCLLAVMDDRQRTLILCVFSESEDGDWGTPHTVELPDNMVIEIAFPAVVHRSAVHWICGTPALPQAVHAAAVRLTEAGTSVTRFNLPPRAGVQRLMTASRAMRLVSSAEGTLSFVLMDELILSIWDLEDSSTERKETVVVLQGGVSDASAATHYFLWEQGGTLHSGVMRKEWLLVLACGG